MRAPYVERIRGVSWSGTNERACSACAWLYMNGIRLPPVCAGVSHCSPDASGDEAYWMRTRRASAGNSMRSAWPRSGSAGSRR